MTLDREIGIVEIGVVEGCDCEGQEYADIKTVDGEWLTDALKDYIGKKVVVVVKVTE